MAQDDGKRRLFLRALLACLTLTQVPALAAGAPKAKAKAKTSAEQALDSFIKAASDLSGIALTDRALARTYLDALRAGFKPGDVAALLAASRLDAAAFASAAAKPPLKDIAQQATLLWLTGIGSDARGAPKVLAYTDAAVWQALTFTKPPGLCGGAFGYWSEAPAAT